MSFLFGSLTHSPFPFPFPFPLPCSTPPPHPKQPGDRVHVTGIFRALAPMSAANTSGNFRTVLLANHCRGIGKEVNGLVMRPTDIKHIKSVAKRDDVFTGTLFLQNDLFCLFVVCLLLSLSLPMKYISIGTRCFFKMICLFVCCCCCCLYP